VTASASCLSVAGSAEEPKEIRREEPLDLDGCDGLAAAVEEVSAREKAEVSVILRDLASWELLCREVALVAEGLACLELDWALESCSVSR